MKKVTCTIALGVALIAGARFDEERNPPPPVTLKEIEQRGVEGRLGMRLGTIVEIAGSVVPNRSRAKEHQGVPFFLSVAIVNGRALAEPVLYRFEPHRFAAVDQPKIGDQFRYAAFETGEFAGAVEGEDSYVRPYASTLYRFTPRLVVLASKK